MVLPRTGHVAHMEHPHIVAAEIGVLLASAAGDPADGDAEAVRTREFPFAPAG